MILFEHESDVLGLHSCGVGMSRLTTSSATATEVPFSKFPTSRSQPEGVQFGLRQVSGEKSEILISVWKNYTGP